MNSRYTDNMYIYYYYNTCNIRIYLCVCDRLLSFLLVWLSMPGLVQTPDSPERLHSLIQHHDGSLLCLGETVSEGRSLQLATRKFSC